MSAADEIHDPINLGTAFDLIGRKSRPTATCHRDDEPLVSTLEFRGAEFYCVICGAKYGFLGPKPADSTPELDARLAELQERYDEERRARRAES